MAMVMMIIGYLGMIMITVMVIDMITSHDVLDFLK